VCGGQGLVLGGSEEVCMRFSPLTEKVVGSWPRSRRRAGSCPAPSRAGTLSNSYCIMVSYLAPASDSAHEGKTRGRAVR
jgi:hypothetical protein